MQHKLSSFLAVCIIGGLLYIVFLFYYIGYEVFQVQATEQLIASKEAEVRNLEKRRNERLQTKYIMLSPQYQDRIAKETQKKLNTGEKEFVVPNGIIHSTENTPPENPYKKTPEQLEREKSVQEQWADVFFGNRG